MAVQGGHHHHSAAADRHLHRTQHTVRHDSHQHADFGDHHRRIGDFRGHGHSPVRHIVTEKYLPIVKSYARSLVNVLSHPKELAFGILGALILNISTGLGFWIALMAFGCHTNPVETTFIFLLANTLGSAVPTPGGLGAVEAALSVAFTAVGIPSTIAVSTTLVYRIAFYWLRIPMGAVAMKWLDRHNLI